MIIDVIIIVIGRQVTDGDGWAVVTVNPKILRFFRTTATDSSSSSADLTATTQLIAVGDGGTSNGNSGHHFLLHHHCCVSPRTILLFFVFVTWRAGFGGLFFTSHLMQMLVCFSGTNALINTGVLRWPQSLVSSAHFRKNREK
uniref:Uncharacterized protein n=1 Tax=Anopheles maculatus TaxID=74869 RepID=A0A182SZK1_9DIPT